MIFFYTPWKPLVFWCFQGVQKKIDSMKWVELTNIHNNNSDNKTNY